MFGAKYRIVPLGLIGAVATTGLASSSVSVNLTLVLNVNLSDNF